ncbi:MAG: hypothetical protein KY456_00130, partial [Chloroflexi bacterium]|nr:hypothetical protein [Chloroflexota bacterium]
MALTEALDAAHRPSAKKQSPFRLSSITPSSKYYWVRLLLENPAVVASLCFLLLMLVLALLAPVIAPFDPNFVNPADRLDPPSSRYW